MKSAANSTMSTLMSRPVWLSPYRSHESGRAEKSAGRIVKYIGIVFEDIR